MDDREIDALVAQANALVPRLNALLTNNDCDVALASIAKLIALYLETMPEDEREAELQSWLWLVRKFAGMTKRPDA
jgi:hypothetical protein